MFPLPWDQAEERKFPARQQTCWPANAVASLCKQHSGPSYSKAVNLSPKREKRPQAWREGVPPEDLGGRRDRSVARGRQLLPAPQQSSKPECIPTSDANGPPAHFQRTLQLPLQLVGAGSIPCSAKLKLYFPLSFARIEFRP